jgi:tRNA G26 N,N-dimethylase Trm1
MIQIKIPHIVIVKSPGLLPMAYKVRELASAIAMPERTLRDWLAQGAPHHRDAQGHIWIIGTEFRVWVEKNRKPKKVSKMRDNQAYCMHCGSVVELLCSETRHVRGKLTSTTGQCPHCKSTIYRGGRLPSNPSPQGV